MIPRTRGFEAEIPSAPFADIAFLLLVFFMVTTTFAATRGLDFTLPENDDAEVVDPVEAVLVVVAAGGGLEVDGRPMAVGDLLTYLRPRLRRNPRKPVIVSPAPDAPYGAMVAVMDELRQGSETLQLPQDLVIALPTARERDLYWR